MEDWEEDDNICKLLQRNDENTSRFGQEGVTVKSLHEELLEVGERLSIASFHEDDDEYSTAPSHQQLTPTTLTKTKSILPPQCAMFKDPKLNNIMTEFFGLSKIMDREIAIHQAKGMREQKESLKERGKFHALQELLFTEHDKLKKKEEDHQRKEREAKQRYDQEMKSLQEDLTKQKKANEELQQEFNKILDAREQEIEDLITENNDFRQEVAATTKEFEELAWENEELAEKVEIKDEYIGSLRFQMNTLEKQHEQDQWKLEQGDDLLEMVEQERDKMEEKYMKKVSKLMQKIKNNSTKCIDGESGDLKIMKSASVAGQNNDSDVSGGHTATSKDLLPADSQRRLQQDLGMDDSAALTVVASKLNLASYDKSSSSFGDLQKREYVKRTLSIQRKPSRSVVVELERMPVVLKSLGWNVRLSHQNKFTIPSEI